MKRKLINVLSHSNGWKVEEANGRLIFHHAPSGGRPSLDSHFCTGSYASYKHSGGKTGPVICEFDSLEKNLLGLYCHAGGMPVKARQIARYEYDAIVASGSRKVAESILKSTFNEEELSRLVSFEPNPADHDKIQVEITDQRYAFRYVFEGWCLSIGKGELGEADSAKAYARLFQALFIRKVYGQDDIIRQSVAGLTPKEQIRMFGIYLTGIEPDPSDVLMPYGVLEPSSRRPSSYRYRKYMLPEKASEFYRVKRFVIWRGMYMISFTRREKASRLFVMYRARPESLPGLLGLAADETDEEALNQAVLEAGPGQIDALLRANGTMAAAVSRGLSRGEEECVAGIWDRYSGYLLPLEEGDLKHPSTLMRALVLVERSGGGVRLYKTQPSWTGQPEKTGEGAVTVDYEEDLSCIARFGTE